LLTLAWVFVALVVLLSAVGLVLNETDLRHRLELRRREQRRRSHVDHTLE